MHFLFYPDPGEDLEQILPIYNYFFLEQLGKSCKTIKPSGAIIVFFHL